MTLTFPFLCAVTGAEGAAGLEQRVCSGEARVAFYMYSMTTTEIMAVADAGLLLPPKVIVHGYIVFVELFTSC